MLSEIKHNDLLDVYGEIFGIKNVLSTFIGLFQKSYFQKFN